MSDDLPTDDLDWLIAAAGEADEAMQDFDAAIKAGTLIDMSDFTADEIVELTIR